MAAASAKRIASVGIALAVLASSAPALAEDQMVLGPRQFEYDKQGGAVLCAWVVLSAVQAGTDACNLTRQPVDDAIDEAIVAIEEFILANSSLQPTRAMLEDFKRRIPELQVRERHQHDLEAYCKESELLFLRNQSPDELRADVKALLAVPREPVWNPCL